MVIFTSCLLHNPPTTYLELLEQLGHRAEVFPMVVRLEDGLHLLQPDLHLLEAVEVDEGAVGLQEAGPLEAAGVQQVAPLAVQVLQLGGYLLAGKVGPLAEFRPLLLDGHQPVTTTRTGLRNLLLEIYVWRIRIILLDPDPNLSGWDGTLSCPAQNSEIGR